MTAFSRASINKTNKQTTVCVCLWKCKEKKKVASITMGMLRDGNQGITPSPNNAHASPKKYAFAHSAWNWVFREGACRSFLFSASLWQYRSMHRVLDVSCYAFKTITGDTKEEARKKSIMKNTRSETCLNCLFQVSVFYNRFFFLFLGRT